MSTTKNCKVCGEPLLEEQELTVYYFSYVIVCPPKTEVVEKGGAWVHRLCAIFISDKLHEYISD